MTKSLLLNMHEYRNSTSSRPLLPRTLNNFSRIGRQKDCRDFNVCLHKVTKTIKKYTKMSAWKCWNVSKCKTKSDIKQRKQNGKNNTKWIKNNNSAVVDIEKNKNTKCKRITQKYRKQLIQKTYILERTFNDLEKMFLYFAFFCLNSRRVLFHLVDYSKKVVLRTIVNSE